MSYNEKSEAITKEEWLQRLEQFPFKQADMNRLIMNYLVTGKQKTNGIFARFAVYMKSCYCRGL